MSKRVVALSLTILMLFSMFGCGNTAPEESTTGTSTTTSESTTTTSETTTETSKTTTETAKVDLDGYVFTIAQNPWYAQYIDWYESPVTEEEQEYMDIWHSLETEYGFTVKMVSEYDKSRYVSFADYMMTCIMSGEKFADIIRTGVETVGISRLEKYLMRLDTDEVKAAGLDVTNGNIFEQNHMDAIRIDGKVYFVSFCGKYFDAQTGYFAAFNKRLCESAGYSAEVIYQAVRDHTWTWDVLLDICREGMVYDENAGEYSVYGMGSILITPYQLAAYGCDPIEYVDGKYVSTLGSLYADAAVAKTLEMRAEGIVGRGWGSFSSDGYFYKEQALFGLTFYLYKSGSYGFDYGIVPLPVGDVRQMYKSPLAPIGFCIQEANGDWATSCFILGKIAEAFGDVEAGIKNLCAYVQDEESMEMIREYILPGLYMSPITLMYSEAMDILGDYLQAMKDGDRTLAAQYAEQFSAAVEEAFKGFNK